MPLKAFKLRLYHSCLYPCFQDVTKRHVMELVAIGLGLIITPGDSVLKLHISVKMNTDFGVS